MKPVLVDFNQHTACAGIGQAGVAANKQTGQFS
jgi:hypothetical protein